MREGEGTIDAERIAAWEAEGTDAEARRILGILLEVARSEQSVDSASELLAPVMRRLSRTQRESVAALLVELGRCPAACAEDDAWGRPGRDARRW